MADESNNLSDGKTRASNEEDIPPRESFLHTRLFVGMLSLGVVLLTSFVFPQQQAYYQRQENDLRLRQEAIKEFSRTITQTISYSRTAKDYACQSRQTTDPSGKRSLEQKAEEYYDKLLSLNPSFEVSCTLIKINFRDPVDGDADELKQAIQSHLDNYYHSKELCPKDDAYTKSESEISDLYDKLIKNMTHQLAQR